MKLNKLALGLLLFATVSLAAWPVSYAYDSSAEGVNVANIQRMGYHNIMKAGKVYKFKFSDGTTAYFLRLPGRGTLKFAQVSEEEYLKNPGEDHNSDDGGTNNSGSSGGSGSGPVQGGSIIIPGGVNVTDGGPTGITYCEPACDITVTQ